jgi:hypothetical protein
MAEETPEKAESFSDYGYTAFEQWEYRPFINVQEANKVWIDFKESFYRASEIIVDRLADGHGFMDIEGVAAIFLFRHYLELALKRIVIRGRYLLDQERNAKLDEVNQVANIHNLDQLWKMVLADAKPKIPEDIWESYDIPFVEQCIAEFHQRDQKGFAFRYPRQGGERYDYDFPFFRKAMEHVYQILENMVTCLIEAHSQNAEWESYLRDEAGF